MRPPALMGRYAVSSRMALWPAWVWLHNLSWIPVWWLRKEVPRECLRWTPAATVRAMARHIRVVQAQRDSYWEARLALEEADRTRRMAEFRATLTPELRQFANNVFGVEF